MFMRYTTRKQNGKEHRYYSLVENRRVAGGRVMQRHALYLGEINDSQQDAYTHPETDVQLLLQRMKLELPAQPPPKISAEPERPTDPL